MIMFDDFFQKTSNNYYVYIFGAKRGKKKEKKGRQSRKPKREHEA
jgi:hypothetical protein